MQTHKESSEVVLTAKEVAAALRVDLSTVYRWVHTGTLNAVQFGPSGYTVRIPAAELGRLSASAPKPAAGGAAPPGVAALARAHELPDLPRNRVTQEAK
jgi:excisionase family DNA binding protein